MHGCVTRCKEIQQHAEADAEELSDDKVTLRIITSGG